MFNQKKKKLYSLEDLNEFARKGCEHKFEKYDASRGYIFFRCVICHLVKVIDFKEQVPTVKDAEY